MAARECWRLLSIYLCKTQSDLRFGKNYSQRQRELLFARLRKDAPVLKTYLKRHLTAHDYNELELDDMFNGINEADIINTDIENIYYFVDEFTTAVNKGFD
jgi:hypothetical protein